MPTCSSRLVMPSPIADASASYAKVQEFHRLFYYFFLKIEAEEMEIWIKGHRDSLCSMKKVTLCHLWHVFRVCQLLCPTSCLWQVDIPNELWDSVHLPLMLVYMCFSQVEFRRKFFQAIRHVFFISCFCLLKLSK